MDHHRLEDIQLKLTIAAGDADCHVVTHHLCCYHRHRLALRRVHLTCTRKCLFILPLQHDIHSPYLHQTVLIYLTSAT